MDETQTLKELLEIMHENDLDAIKVRVGEQIFELVRREAGISVLPMAGAGGAGAAPLAAPAAGGGAPAASAAPAGPDRRSVQSAWEDERPS